MWNKALKGGICMQKNRTVSWIWIIFWCVFFFPVGVFLIYKKINSDKTATLNNSKTVFTISYVLLAFSIIYVTMIFSEGVSMITAALVTGAGGIWLNRIAKKMKTNGEKYKKYITLVINQNMTEIDNIAPALNVSYEIAKEDLQKMIDLGYFVGAYINENSREIILAKHSNNTPNQSKVNLPATRVVVCKSCGANNSISIGVINNCEYCGSSIE